MKTVVRCAATTFILTGGLGLASGGAATVASAQVGDFPSYHWCPSEDWHPEWGNNWDAGSCHDDHHRDIDGNDHHRDFGAPTRFYVPRYHWCPGEFWRPEWGFNFDWNACHDDHHRDGDGDNHSGDFWG